MKYLELGDNLWLRVDGKPLPVAHKRFEQLDGTGHNDVSVSDPARYLRIAAAFCERVAAGQPPPAAAL